MFDHVEIRVADLKAGGDFYRLALGPPGHESEEVTEWGDFDIAQASAESPATQRLHIGFAAHGREEVDAWWKRMTGAGYVSDGDPGVRPQYNETYYGAFVLDPDGHNIEAVCHTPE